MPVGMATTRSATNENGAVLLTGATGLVGGELLVRLLVRDRRLVFCLVRGDSPHEAAARGLAALERMLERAATYDELQRITWVCGDVEAPHLGIDPAERERLAASVEEIFHCAASTRFDQPLAEARSVNVEGVARIHALAVEAAARRPFRRLHHVSTAYASGVRRGMVRADDLPMDDPRAFRNTYERTKAEAERLLRATARVPVTVYRPSIIVGDSRSGRTTSWNVVYFPMRLMAAGALPLVPCRGPALLDCVPVDFVADAIVALGSRDDTAGATLHLTAGEQALTVHEVIRHTYAGVARRDRAPLCIGTRAVGMRQWRMTARVWSLVGGARVRRALARFAVYAPYTSVAGMFDDAHERALLAEHGVRLPEPGVFFARIVDYALACDFGRATPRPRAQQEEAPRRALTLG
jgi:thioester reductase-like protein